jgi:hypothetical protein
MYAHYVQKKRYNKMSNKLCPVCKDKGITTEIEFNEDECDDCFKSDY